MTEPVFTFGSWTYLALLGACLALTLPLEWVFHARVWRRPRRLARAVLPVAAIFYLWDALVIARGHWWFSAEHTTGVVLPLGVPIEEALFFLVIPVCALLSLESVRNLLAGDWLGADLLARRRRAAVVSRADERADLPRVDGRVDEDREEAAV